jgi:hypothetical protein
MAATSSGPVRAATANSPAPRSASHAATVTTAGMSPRARLPPGNAGPGIHPRRPRVDQPAIRTVVGPFTALIARPRPARSAGTDRSHASSRPAGTCFEASFFDYAGSKTGGSPSESSKPTCSHWARSGSMPCSCGSDTRPVPPGACRRHRRAKARVRARTESRVWCALPSDFRHRARDGTRAPVALSSSEGAQLPDKGSKTLSSIFEQLRERARSWGAKWGANDARPQATSDHTQPESPQVNSS